MSGEALGFAGVVVAALFALWGAYLTYKANRRRDAGTLALEYATKLTTRLDGVETRLANSESALRSAIRYLDDVYEWGVDAGAKPPPPHPPQVLDEYLDPTRYRPPQKRPSRPRTSPA